MHLSEFSIFEYSNTDNRMDKVIITHSLQIMHLYTFTVILCQSNNNNLLITQINMLHI